MTDGEAAPGATPSWLRPLGADPDLADVAVRAAVVGRMAGRVASLASDLQLLAMLLQDAAGAGSQVARPVSGTRSSSEDSHAGTPPGASREWGATDAGPPESGGGGERATGAGGKPPRRIPGDPLPLPLPRRENPLPNPSPVATGEGRAVAAASPENDPFARAEAAVGALREALRPSGARPDDPA